jgi:SAM-dependent MidA family methyltransferase
MVKEFEAATENASLKEIIVRRILAVGGIPFRDFMAMALYEPELGYYASRRQQMGHAGDYVTSPETGPIFGALLGRQLREMWDLLGRPPQFRIVEAGAGSGALCRDILRWAARAAPGFAEAIHYTIVESSAVLVERQRSLLAAEGLKPRVRWDDRLPPEITGCILSNELLDSFPVHRVVVEAGVLREIYVNWNGERFVEELRPPSTPAIEAYFQDIGLLPAEGCRAEVNLDSVRWMREAAAALKRGYLLTIDYGYEAAELYAPWRRDGTLVCFYRHNPSADPYARIGRQDITAHVDFTSLRRAGEDSGLTTLALVSQSDFLINLGIADAVQPPAAGETDLEEYYAKRRAVMELIDPSKLGRLRVLVQSRGVETRHLSGLSKRGS